MPVTVIAPVPRETLLRPATLFAFDVSARVREPFNEPAVASVTPTLAELSAAIVWVAPVSVSLELALLATRLRLS